MVVDDLRIVSFSPLCLRRDDTRGQFLAYGFERGTHARGCTFEAHARLHIASLRGGVYGKELHTHTYTHRERERERKPASVDAAMITMQQMNA